MITLLFVKGIDKNNVPYHKSESDRDAYFASKGGVVIDGFYPPYYTNTFNVSTEDVEDLWEANYNYCILEFEGRKYYYFINDLNYVSEDVAELTIEMDTITTFMFSIRFMSGMIERKFIDRWNSDDTINRSYIRENVSSNEFNVPSVTCLNSNKTDWVVMLKATQLPGSGTTLGPASTTFINSAFVGGSDAGFSESPYAYGFTPYNVAGTFDSVNISYDPAKFGEQTEMYDMYLIPFNGVKNYSISSSGVITWTGQKYQFWISGKTGVSDSYALYNPIYTNVVQTKDVRLTFIRNKNKGMPYTNTYIPALLDENYIRVSIGDSQFEATYPLFNAKTPSMRCAYWADLSTGTRYYNIVFHNGTSYPLPSSNEYNTIVANTNVLSDDLKNDAWKQYISANKASFINATMQDMGSMARTVYYMQDAGAGYEDAMSKVYLSKHAYDRRYKTEKHLRKWAARKLDRLSGEYADETTGAGMRNMGQSYVANYLVTRTNLQFTPQGVRQTGNLIKEVNGGSAYIYYKESRVMDYRNVAWYYHTNGYLVTEPFGTRDLFSYINTRQYYNVLKCSEVNFYLIVAQPRAVLDDIEDRLLSGITLWNYSLTGTLKEDYVEIGDYSLDNVEKSYIK